MNGQTVITTAPGKMILLGEHSVVYGKPAVALAIDRRFRCTVRKSGELLVNGHRASGSIAHPHIRSILKDNGVPNVSIDAESSIPTSSGLGSSAALSASVSMAVRALYGKEVDEERIANDAFIAEYTAQGRASPMDTSVCTHGLGVALNCPGGKPLWTISKGGNTWDVSEIKVPKMTFVVGYTGIHAPTGPIVERVRKYKEHNRFASDIIDEIGDVTLDGMKCVTDNDRVGLGRAMTYDHKLLSILGVSCDELNKLVNASLPYSYGAKLTGSGGGGSMIALTDRPDKVCEAIAIRGGRPMIVHTGEPGVRIEERR